MQRQNNNSEPKWAWQGANDDAIDMETRFAFKNALIQKLSNLDEMNQAVKDRQGLKFNEKPISITEADEKGLFDASGKWSNKENGWFDKYRIDKCLNEILSPETLNTLSDRQKIIFEAVYMEIIYDMQKPYIDNFLEKSATDSKNASKYQQEKNKNTKRIEEIAKLEINDLCLSGELIQLLDQRSSSTVVLTSSSAAAAGAVVDAVALEKAAENSKVDAKENSHKANEYAATLLAKDNITAKDYQGYIARFMQESTMAINEQFKGSEVGKLNLLIFKLINATNDSLNRSGKLKNNTITSNNQLKQDAIQQLNAILMKVINNHIIKHKEIVLLDILEIMNDEKILNKKESIENRIEEYYTAEPYMVSFKINQLKKEFDDDLHLKFDFEVRKIINEFIACRLKGGQNINEEDLKKYLNLRQIRENYLRLSAALKESKEYQTHLKKEIPADINYDLSVDEKLTWSPPKNQTANLETKVKLNQKMINIMTHTTINSTADDSLRQIRNELNEAKNRNILSANRSNRFTRFINALADIVTLGLWTTEVRGVSNFWRSHGADHVDRLSEVIKLTSPKGSQRS